MHCNSTSGSWNSTVGNSYTWYVISDDTHTLPSVCGNDNCHSLTYYVNHYSQYFTTGSTFIFLSTGIHLLNAFPPLINVHDLTLQGYSMGTVVCHDTSSGFSFINSSSITLNSLQIINCSRNDIHGTALSFINVEAVSLFKVMVMATGGVGAKFHNVSKIDVMDSHFSDNGLQVFNCSLETSQLWHSISITADINEPPPELYYTFLDTLFKGNSPQFGGGVFVDIPLIKSASIFFIQTTFIGITGCLATALNISVDYSDSAEIQIQDSIFIDTHRIDVPNYLIHKEIEGGAVKIKTNNYNSPYMYGFGSHIILISNSTFAHNIAKHCAGIAILYTSSNNSVASVIVTIEKSHFYNNVATIGRAGGFCIRPTGGNGNDRKLQHYITVKESSFEHNEAMDGAAGLFWPSWSDINVYNITIINCSVRYNVMKYQFTKPYYEITSGVIMLRWSSYGASTGNTVLLTNSTFIGNKMGPSVWLWGDNTASEGAIQAVITHCYFYNNSGAYVSGGIKVSFTRTFYSLLISSCIFHSNSGDASGWESPTSVIGIQNYMSFLRQHSKGLITLQNLLITESNGSRHAITLQCDNQLSVINISNITMVNNHITALGSINCALKFSGLNKFINNTTPYSGGALVVNGTGYAYTDNFSSSLVIFMNNKARMGGALYSSAKYSKSYMILACTFLNIINALFINNTASVTGRNIYGGVIVSCLNYTTQILVGLSPDCNELTGKGHMSFMQSNDSISSDPFSIFLCHQHNSTIDYYTKRITREVYPGQSFKVSLVTAGDCRALSPGVLQVSSSKGIHVMTDTSNEYTLTTCKDMYYTPMQTLAGIFKGSMSISIANSVFRYQRPLQVDIHLLQCPHGMILGENGICTCDPSLETLDSVSCNVSLWPYPIVKNSDTDRYWLSYNEEYNCTVVTHCPFDYCSSVDNIDINLNNGTDGQCTLYRSGILCGQCKEGYSLQLGSNDCTKCTNIYLLLFLLFAVAGVSLVLLLIEFNLTVSVGNINGLLFYANIVKLNEQVYFPNGPVPVISQFISWINLDFGFKVCFINGLNGYWKTWLQFLFPFYVCLLVMAIIIASRNSIRLSYYLRSNIVSVLATLILMSFTKTLRNITNALMATKIEYTGEQYTVVWSVDGNVDYLNFKHALLMGFSVLILLGILIYTFVILTGQWLQAYSGKICKSSTCNLMFRLQPFLDAYTGPYKEKHRYWPGILLVLRIFMTFIFIYTSGSVSYVNNYIIILSESLLVLSILSCNFHHSSVNYYYEKFFHINLLCLSCLNSLLSQSHYKMYTSHLTTLSVSLAILAFIPITGQHCIINHIKDRYLKSNNAILPHEIEPLINDDSSTHRKDYSATEVVCRRDSIIYDVYITN